MPANGPCPSCGGQLVPIERSGVRIDACRQCRGVFLDRGELDQILERERAYVAEPHDDDDDEFFREMSGSQGLALAPELRLRQAHRREAVQGLQVAQVVVAPPQEEEEELPRRALRLAPAADARRRQDFALLAIGVLCASTAPPLIAATAAPALAIAFWRTGAAAAILLADVAVARAASCARHRASPWLALLAGAALAAHFGTFIPSLSVHVGRVLDAALVCSQAVWAGLLGRLLGERLPRRAWVGHRGLPRGRAAGDRRRRLAVGAGARRRRARAGRRACSAASYIVTGGFVRRDLSTLAYTLHLLRRVRAAAAGRVPGRSGRPLTGYAAADWVRIAALTVVRPAARALAVQLRAALDQPDDRVAGDAVHGAARGRDRRDRARADAAGRRRSRRSRCSRRDRHRDQRARAGTGGGDLSIRAVVSAASSAMQIAEPTHQMQIASSSNTST